jgi:hypothetical protein
VRQQFALSWFNIPGAPPGVRLKLPHFGAPWP